MDFSIKLLVLGLALILVGYFLMRGQNFKQNTIDVAISVIFLEPFFSGLGILIVGVLLMILGIYSIFN